MLYKNLFSLSVIFCFFNSIHGLQEMLKKMQNDDYTRVKNTIQYFLNSNFDINDYTKPFLHDTAHGFADVNLDSCTSAIISSKKRAKITILQAYTNSKHILALADHKEVIRLYNLINGKKIEKIKIHRELQPEITDIIFNPEGTHFLYSFNFADPFFGQSSAIMSYNVDTKTEICLFSGILREIEKIAISKNHSVIAYYGDEHITFIKNRREIFRTGVHPDGLQAEVEHMNFNEAGNRLAVIFSNKRGSIVDINARGPLLTQDNVSPSHEDFKDYFCDEHDFVVPNLVTSVKWPIYMRLTPEYIKKSFFRLDDDQKSLLYFLVVAEKALHERHAERQEREKETYKHRRPMPVDFELLEKYNPAIEAKTLHKTLSDIPSPFREYVVKRFSIVRKKNFWDHLKKIFTQRSSPH